MRMARMITPTTAMVLSHTPSSIQKAALQKAFYQLQAGLFCCLVRWVRSVSHEVLPFIHAWGYGDIEEADHHFLIGLAAPADGLFRIRIVRIVLGIVEPCHRLQLRACLEKTRLRQTVTHLPMKIVVHPKQRFDASVRMHNIVLKAFSPQMHMRKKAE